LPALGLTEMHGPNGKMSTGIIAENPLAAKFLYNLLRANTGLEVTLVAELSDSTRVADAFIADNSNLPLPIGECLRWLRSHFPRSKLIVLDSEIHPDQMMYLRECGMDGVVEYRSVDRDLLSALERVLAGGLWLSFQPYTDGRGFDSIALTRDRITPREAQVIELVQRRLSNKEIARMLNIQESTVKFHLSNLFSKLHLTGRHELSDKTERKRNIVCSCPARKESFGSKLADKSIWTTT